MSRNPWAAVEGVGIAGEAQGSQTSRVAGSAPKERIQRSLQRKRLTECPRPGGAMTSKRDSSHTQHLLLGLGGLRITGAEIGIDRAAPALNWHAKTAGARSADPAVTGGSRRLTINSGSRSCCAHGFPDRRSRRGWSRSDGIIWKREKIPKCRSSGQSHA